MFDSCKVYKNENILVSSNILIDESMQSNIDFILSEWLNKASKSKGIDTIFFESGKYYFSKQLLSVVLNRNICIQGLGDVKFYANQNVFHFKSPIVYSNKVNSNLKRGDKIIHLEPMESKIDLKHTILSIYSNDYVEVAWKYKKGEIQIIEDYKNNIITLKDSLVFFYDSKEKTELIIYKPYKVIVNNIEFVVNEGGQWNYDFLLRTDGCISEANNLVFTNSKKEQEGTFWLIDRNVNCKINNFKSTNLMYGLLLSYSKNIVINKVEGNNCTHPVVPANFTQNVFVDHFRGKNTSIDAHPSFNVNYNDVDIYTGKGFFNCRAFGVKLTNCNFTCDPDFNDSSIYIGGISLRPEYDFLYNEFDVFLENVVWKHKLNGFNGLTVNKCREFIVNNCESHLISTGNTVKKVEVTNSKIGHFKCYDANFTITNSQFISTLQNINNPKPPITCSFHGIAKIENCTFQNYNNYLIEFLSGPGTNISFKDCDFGSLKNLVKEFQFPDSKYEQIRFDNCKMKSVLEIPKQFSVQRKSILNQNALSNELQSVKN